MAQTKAATWSPLDLQTCRECSLMLGPVSAFQVFLMLLLVGWGPYLDIPGHYYTQRLLLPPSNLPVLPQEVLSTSSQN